MARQRKPRAPLAETAAETETASITKAVAEWRARHEEKITPEGSRRFFEDAFLHWLQTGDDPYNVALVVELGRAGHAVADAALRTYIQAAIEVSQFERLPTTVRAYAHWALGRAPAVAKYTSQDSQAVNHFTRDVFISLLIERVQACWPDTPLLYSSRRPSAAAIVGAAFGLGEAQTRRIFAARDAIAWRLVAFWKEYPNKRERAECAVT